MLPGYPVMLELLVTNTNDPGDHPVPVLKAGFAELVEVIAPLINAKTYRGYAGLPACVYKFTLLAELMFTTLVGVKTGVRNKLISVYLILRHTYKNHKDLFRRK